MLQLNVFQNSLHQLFLKPYIFILTAFSLKIVVVVVAVAVGVGAGAAAAVAVEFHALL